MSEETTTLEKVRALRPEIAARAEEIEGLRALPRTSPGSCDRPGCSAGTCRVRTAATRCGRTRA